MGQSEDCAASVGTFSAMWKMLYSVAPDTIGRVTIHMEGEPHPRCFPRAEHVSSFLAARESETIVYFDCVFRLMSSTDSGRRRPPVPA
jgi:hypothetical protein